MAITAKSYLVSLFCVFQILIYLLSQLLRKTEERHGPLAFEFCRQCERNCVYRLKQDRILIEPFFWL